MADGFGDNSGADKELRLLIERVERLNEEIAGLQADKRDVFAEAKARGYDPRTMRSVIAQRKLDANVRAERAALFETYMAALGLL